MSLSPLYSGTFYFAMMFSIWLIILSIFIYPYRLVFTLCYIFFLELAIPYSICCNRCIIRLKFWCTMSSFFFTYRFMKFTSASLLFLKSWFNDYNLWSSCDIWHDCWFAASIRFSKMFLLSWFFWLSYWKVLSNICSIYCLNDCMAKSMVSFFVLFKYLNINENWWYKICIILLTRPKIM